MSSMSSRYLIDPAVQIDVELLKLLFQPIDVCLSRAACTL